MKYNFDKVIDRKGSGCFKWDTLEETYGDRDILPMSVADMDFKSADEIIAALKNRVDHGIFGYNCSTNSFFDSIINWAKKRYGWNIEKEWIVITPGVVSGLNICIRALTKESDGIVIQPPVYAPFFNVINKNNRTLITNPLIIKGGKYSINFMDLEIKLKTAKALILCSPHNPVGRVWSKDELKKITKLCIENNVLIISDEIHCDLILKGFKHTNIASISEEAKMNSVTFIAPSKTFNLPGLYTSVAIIPNEEIRNKVKNKLSEMHMDNIHIFGAVSLEAAYNHGEKWLEEVLVYIEKNIDYVIDYVKRNIPEIKIIRPEGTYLLWLDFRELGLSQEKLNELMIKKGKVFLLPGSAFGKEGTGFLRLNVGCPRVTVYEALKRIEKAIR